MLLTASLFSVAIMIGEPPRFPNLGKLTSGGAIAWGSPLCLLAKFRPGKPLILGNDCVYGFVPVFEKRRIVS